MSTRSPKHLDQPAAVQALLARLDDGPRLALSLYGLTESTEFSLTGISHALRILGTDPVPALRPLLELGLLAIASERVATVVDDFGELLELKVPWRMWLRVHPAVPKNVRTARPCDTLPRAVEPIGQVREPDGLEAVLRLAALWQRVGAEPLRQTQQGVLYKRDRDRIELDAVLASPVADALVALRRVTVVVAGPGASSRADQARGRRRAPARGNPGILDRERIPPAPDDRHRVALAARLV